MTTGKEKHRATVKDVNDPDKRGRIRVASATLMGVDSSGEARDYPGWIEPSFPVLFGEGGDKMTAGWFAIPSVGATIEIELSNRSTFDQSPDQTAISDPDPRWRSCLLRSGDSVADEFKENYPKRLGYKTASGHTLIFDDSDSGDVFLKHKQGGELRFEGGGDVVLHDGSRNGVTLRISDGKITIGKTGIELLSLIDQIMTAVGSFGSAAAIAETSLLPANLALQIQLKLISTLLSQIKG